MSQVVTAKLKQEQDFRFAIAFAGGAPPIYGDEPPPLGKASGPSPMQLLAAAVGNCLSDSLLFALRKFKQNPEPIETAVAATVDRNSENRLRVMNISVKLTLGVPAESLAHLDRALAQFEEFCTVSQSVRQGIPVTVEVCDSSGRRLK
ncbi:MAG: OsmC family protein [Betaproteobacteria bacterium]|nr:OsmC family protein [Betaproteobacteria bacterium]MBI2959191.1 OsmC family protein [Betaproteobacteria bacterium]